MMTFQITQFDFNLELEVKYRCSKVPGGVSAACRCAPFGGTESAKRGAFCFATKANQETCDLGPPPTEWESQRGTAREEDRNAGWSGAVQ